MLFKMSSSGVSITPYGSQTSASEDCSIARYCVLLMSMAQFLLGLGAGQFVTKCMVDHTADPGLLITILRVERKNAEPLCIHCCPVSLCKFLKEDMYIGDECIELLW